MGLVRDGVLQEIEIPGRRARGYVLAPEWRRDVEELSNERLDPGFVREGTRLVEISGDLTRLVVGLSNASEERAFSWATRVGAKRFLVLLSGSSTEIDSAQLALEQEGLQIGLAEQVMGAALGPRELRAWAAHLDRGGEKPAAASRYPEVAVEEGDGGDGS